MTKTKLRIVLKNGNIREFSSDKFTSYVWRPEAFIVLSDEQWIAIFNWAEVREVIFVEPGKERDATNEDIQHCICDSCIKTGTDRCTGVDGLAVTCPAWEWRGVQDDGT